MRNSQRFRLQKEISYLPVIYLFAGLLFSLLSKAQPDPEKGLPFITNYTPKTFKALPQAWCTIEDKQGFMYFGVQSAILEYDGVKWRKVIFTGTPPPVVRSLARDKNGVVYYGAAADFGYLSRDSLGQTHAVSLLQYIPESYRNFFDVWTIYVNGTDIYFQSREYIFRINEKRQVKTWIPKTKFMYAFFYDDTYFVHQQGVGFLKLVKDSLQLIPGSEFLGQERMQVMLPHTPSSTPPGKPTGKQYLLGLFYGGLFVFDGTGFSPFKTEADELIKAATLYKGAILPNGNIALSTTGKGLAILDPAGKILQLINRDVGLQDESVYGVYSDSKGTLWLTLDNGISRVETNSPLTQFTNQSGINTATLSIQRFDGKLYVGTTNGLLKFNKQTASFDQVNGVPPNQTFKLVPDGNTLLVPNDGLFSIHNDKTTLIRSSIGGDLQLSGLYISKAHPNMLLGGATFGVAVFYKDMATQTWRFKGHIPKLDDQFWTFSENKDGTIWAGTQSNVVYKVTPAFNENGEPDILRFTYQRFDETHGLKNSSGAVYNLKGETWFVGDSSLFKFDETQNRFYPDTTFGHFPGGGGISEFDIVEDHAGRVWLRFGKETILATPQSNGKYRIDKTPFLPLADRSFSGIYPEANGIVWICTTDGLIRYDESLEKNYALPFKTLLRHVTAGKDILNPDVITTDKNKVTVSFKNNTLRFEYAAPFFEQEDKTLYQTWLEGFEETWSGYDNNYYKEYTNLPAGKYHFHVRAKNVYQKLSEESVYPFTIRPAWYASWWAYLLYVLAALAIVYIVVRNRTRHLKQQHRELEKTVSERTVQLRQRVEELAVINSVQDALVREMDMQAIYELVGNRIRDVFNSQVVIIATFDHEAGMEHFQYLIEKGQRSYPSPRPLDKLRQHLIKTKQKIVINQDSAIAMKKFGLEVLPGTATPKSSVFVPLTIGDKINSYISLQDIDKEHAFAEPDVRLLETLANSMSVALENARLFDETTRLLKETEQRTAELAVINSVQEGLAKELDMQAIYELVGERIRSVFDAQAVIIATFDYETDAEHFNYTIEKGERFYLKPRPLDKLRTHLIQTGQKVVINHVEEAMGWFGTIALPGTKPMQSGMFVPLTLGEKVTGYISLQNVDKENAFSESDVRLLETLANSMSVALENARLFDETTRLLKETEQRTAELAVINSVQEGLAKELDMQGIYDLVGDRLCDLFPDTQTLVIRTFDHETGLEYFQYAIEKGTHMKIAPQPFMWANKSMIATKKPIDIREKYVEVAKQHGGTGVTKGQPPKSAVFVPMLVGDIVKGSISLQNVDREKAFTDSDLRLLTTITNSMSVALENARLFDETNRLLKETEQRTAELAVINSVQDGLVREMNMQAIYDLVGNRICELFDTQTVLIRTFDQRAELEHWQYVIEKGQRLYSNPRPFIWANKILIKTGQPLLINENYVETAQKHGGSGVSKGLPPKSALFVPMVVGDVVRGSVSLQNVEKENAFSESDLRLLTTLTNSMSVALENARLFDETNRLLGEAKQRANELSTVNNVSQALASQLNPDELIKLVGDQMRDLFKANIVYLALLDAKSKMIHFVYQYGDDMESMKLGEGLTSKIILSGEPLLINKDLQELRVQIGVRQVGLPAASYLGVPIPVGDEVIGVLSVQSTEQESRFNQNDLRLLSTIAASVGVALRKAKLFEEVQLAKMDAEAARKAAEKANEAKSAFLSTVSHELRTPLTSVLGFTKIIKKRLEEKIFPAIDTTDSRTEKIVHQISDNLNVVISEGERLTNLINEVLDLAKIEAGKMEWNMESVSMQDVAERAISATTSLFDQKNLALKVKFQENLPLLSGDRDKLIQVMVNLISNAVKFTPAGTITCSISQKRNEIITGITDTGIGIAAADHDAVFEQFKQVVGDTLTDKPKGTGLGLPICKQIVEHHNGRIWLESEPGKGSTFFFAIPVQKTGAGITKPIHLDDLVKQLKEQMAQSSLNMKGRNATILVVDDDDSIRSLLMQELGDAGYIIEEATNGNEALASIRNHRPDLIILDVMMPEMNGFDVAAILKNDPQTMDIPIIVLSIVQDKARGFRIGVDRYLTKPIDTVQLFTEVGSLLEQGKSKKKVMVVDEDSTAVRTLTDVLHAKGYQVVESDGKELVEKAIRTQPDIIILNSVLSDKHEIVQSLRFEKGLENVLFLIYQ